MKVPHNRVLVFCIFYQLFASTHCPAIQNNLQNLLLHFQMDRRSSNEMASPLGLSGLNLSGAGGGGHSPFQSPFLQVDPSVLQPPLISNEFIFPEGATKSSRGRFELAFGQIGFSVGMGAGIGGAMGTLKGNQL